MKWFCFLLAVVLLFSGCSIKLTDDDPSMLEESVSLSLNNTIQNVLSAIPTQKTPYSLRKTAIGFQIGEYPVGKIEWCEIPLELWDEEMSEERHVDRGVVQEMRDYVWQYIGRQGEVLSYSYIEPFNNGGIVYAVVEKSTPNGIVYGVVDADFNEIIPVQYDILVPVRFFDNQNPIEGVFYAKKNDTWITINLQEGMIYSYDYVFDDIETPYYSFDDFNILTIGYAWFLDYFGDNICASILPEIFLPAFDGTVFELYDNNNTTCNVILLENGIYTRDTLTATFELETVFSYQIAVKSNAAMIYVPQREEASSGFEKIKQIVTANLDTDNVIIGNWEIINLNDKCVVSVNSYQKESETMACYILNVDEKNNVTTLYSEENQLLKHDAAYLDSFVSENGILPTEEMIFCVVVLDNKTVIAYQNYFSLLSFLIS